MKAYHITGPTGLDALQLVDLPEPDPGPHDVVVDMRAWSLNYRDLSMPHGGYPRNDKVKHDPPMIPLSDGAGEIVAVGDRVTRFRPGDRVAGCFFQNWITGELTESHIGSALGGAVDGVLAERVCLREDGLVHIPTGYSFEQAATLPCAAVTAWQALTMDPLKPGQSVLLLGTGGVSIFALQFAKASGARVLITSSSNDKLARARELGADETINYREQTDWHKAARELTGGVGVDHVVEVGGAGTFARSLQATRVSGRVSLIGVLSGRPDADPSPLPILFNRLTVQGIYVGSREMFEEMNRAIEVNGIEPVIDRTFDFGDARQAYEHLASGAHFGKVVVRR